MRILYLHQYFNTPHMSGGTRSFEMARRLVAHGHEVHMITTWRGSRDDHECFEEHVAGIQVYWFPVEYSNHMSFVDRTKAFLLFALKAAIKGGSIQADVVFATSTPLTIALPAVFICKKKKIPLVFEVRDLWPSLPIAVGALKNPFFRFLARRLEVFAYHSSESVIALSPGIKEGVLHTGYPAKRIAMIPNSSDTKFFRVDVSYGKSFRAKNEWLSDRPLLVYTGAFGMINGVSYMVELAQALAKLHSDVCILLVGDGVDYTRVEERALVCGVLNHNLFIKKSLPKKEMPAVLSAATMASALFIDLPEMRSNSANKFFDALAAGTPIMINYGGWMHDLLVEYDCGLPMWKKTIDEVANELDCKMHNGEWLAKASQSAMKLADECFCRDILGNRLMAVLQATVDGESERAAELAP